ncbi:L-tyrosine/L-tryptophan isonitrile synthase family protein [Shewanella sp. VB17]|nr:L-tyrosine/L-tryptophan isonitrile synthase family protein [Shewanella sp. VB17]
MQFSHFKITKTELISKIQGEESAVFESYLNKIQVQLKQNLPIKMVLPAFPAKSPNRNKAHDSIPDMADNLALLHGRCAFEEHTVRHLRRIQMR